MRVVDRNGALVARSGEGVLITGPGGTGKSTAGTPGHLANGKRVLYVRDVFPDHLPAEARVRAIALSRVTAADESALRPARPVEALRRMAVSTLALSTCDGESALRWLGEVARRLPCFWLDLGRDLGRVPDRR